MGRARRDESGFSVIEYTLMVSLTFLILVWGANLILWSYGKGVVHSAVDQAARAMFWRSSQLDMDTRPIVGISNSPMPIIHSRMAVPASSRTHLRSQQRRITGPAP